MKTGFLILFFIAPLLVIAQAEMPTKSIAIDQTFTSYKEVQLKAFGCSAKLNSKMCASIKQSKNPEELSGTLAAAYNSAVDETKEMTNRLSSLECCMGLRKSLSCKNLESSFVNVACECRKTLGITIKDSNCK